MVLSLIHISEPTRLGMISYAVFCLKKKLNSLKYRVRSQITLLKPQKSFLNLVHIVHYKHNMYNNHDKVVLNFEASNMNAHRVNLWRPVHTHTHTLSSDCGFSYKRFQFLMVLSKKELFKAFILWSVFFSLHVLI